MAYVNRPRSLVDWNKQDISSTCKRGSAAVVRTSNCSYGKGQILHLSRAETTVPINTKFWMIDYVGEIMRIARFGWDWRASPRVSEIYSFTVFFLFVSLVRLQTAIRNGFWFWCRPTMAQNTSFGVGMCLLSILSIKIECMGIGIPKILSSTEIRAKTKTFESTQ